jgi:branched-chain amino acid transport system substrate-binding protein
MMTGRVSSLLGALVLALVVGSATAHAAPAAPSGPPIEINAILSLTGNAAFAGSTEAVTLKIVEDQVNAAGGIGGRPVHFNVLDDATNPQLDVQLANGLVSKGVPLFLGPNIPAGCLAVGPIIDKNGPLGVCLNPFVHPAAGSYQFAPFSDSYEVARANVRYFRDKGWTRIAMINATDGTGQDADAAFAYALKLPENRNVVLVGQEHYGAGDVSVTAQLARLKAQNPQAIISYNTGLPFGTVLRGMRDLGMDIPVATGGGNMSYAQMQQYASILPSIMLFGGQMSFAPGDVGPGPIHDLQMAYVRALKKFGKKPEVGYGVMWDPAHLAVETMRHIGPAGDTAAARAYLAQLHSWVGINGVYDFKSYPQRGLDVNSVLMLQWNAKTQTFEGAGRRGGAIR